MKQDKDTRQEKCQVHAYIRGWVQGVGFRWFVLHHAHLLGLTGWVCNLHDGRVELVAEGQRGTLEELLRLVRKGPSGARVFEVHDSWNPYTGKFSSFQVRYPGDY